MKTVLKVLGIITVVVILIVGGFAIFMSSGMDTTKNAQVATVNTAELADGNYEGAYEAGRFSNKVLVTVKGGKIESIRADKTVTFERPEMTKALFDSVIARQNTDVDVQSGATLTSKAYLKSIEYALGQKQK